MLAVSTHSRLKAAGLALSKRNNGNAVSTHSRLKAAGAEAAGYQIQIDVSTHSRLKAAGSFTAARPLPMRRFNTQPPEGGWKTATTGKTLDALFQHTAA